MRVLVTGTSLFFSRVLIQGFARHGAEVTAADSSLISTGKMSRFTSRRLRVPSMAKQPEAYIRALVNELERREYDLVVPSFEEALLLSQHRASIEAASRLLLPSHATMMTLHHKPSLYELCDRIGVKAPASIFPSSTQQLAVGLDRLQLPVILKLPLGNNSLGVVYASQAREVLAKYQELSQAAARWEVPGPLVQEVVTGRPIYTLMYCYAGKKLGEVIYRPLRTYPARGGTSAHRQTIVHPEIEQITRQMARATGWTGFLGFDFIEDEKSGELNLIDANPRPNPGLTLGVLSGIDWAGLQLDLLSCRVPVPVPPVADVRDRSWILDFAWLFDGGPWDRHWGSRFVDRLKELNSMRPLLTSWKGKLQSDGMADLGLWIQLLRAFWTSRRSG
ncbi:MAG: hypothetical protein ACK5TO_19285, partial [Planctomycetaceae bacterium]